MHRQPVQAGVFTAGRLALVVITGAMSCLPGEAMVGDPAGRPPDDGTDVVVQLDPQSLILARGKPATVVVTLTTATAVSPGPWLLSANGLGPGVTATFDPPLLVVGGQSQLTLNADPTAPGGTTSIDVVASRAGTIRLSQLDITIPDEAGETVLTPEVPISGLSAAQDSQLFFVMSAPTGVDLMTFTTSGGSGDVDVYVSYGTRPTLTQSDCKSTVPGNLESCLLYGPLQGAWHVMLVARGAFQDVTILGSLKLHDAGAGGGNGGTGGGGGGSASGGGAAGGGGGRSSGGGSAGGGSPGGGNGGGGHAGGSGGTGGGAHSGGGTGSGGGVGAGGGAGGGSPTGVGPQGGTVSLLHFGVSGDTRPLACEDTPSYPTAIIQAIAQDIQARAAQFAIDLGDHMYVCNNDLTIARTQMGLFTTATARFRGPWFMTMGNHECWHGPCLAGSQNANYLAFMEALAPYSSSPFYVRHVQTSLGRASFVFLADNAWSQGQAVWLESTLRDTDLHSTYTFVIRHHPGSDTSVPTNADSLQIIQAHKYTLFMTGHEHLYHHTTYDLGRDLILGNAGAPLIASGTFNGYAMVDQQSDGRITVTVYNVIGNAPVDSWSVGPN